MINACWEDTEFTIQQGQAEQWRRIVDTSLASPDDIEETGKGHPISALRYVVKARSIVVMVR